MADARTPFAADAAGGQLAGWVQGAGLPVLLLHGGPGMGYEYLDALAAELADGYRVAAFQQRGLSPSTLDGPFTMATAVDDVSAVLRALGWARAVVVGHSWGGHLALRFAAAHPERLLGLLCIDPVGVVGDGGIGATFAELAARTPSEGRARLLETAQQKPSGGEEVPEALRVLWPAYFADPRQAPPLAVSRLRDDVNGALMAELLEGLEPTAAALSRCQAPSLIVAGAASPVPWGQASRATSELLPHGALKVIPGVGHYPWLEAPGEIRAALDELASRTRR